MRKKTHLKKATSLRRKGLIASILTLCLILGSILPVQAADYILRSEKTVVPTQEEEPLIEEPDIEVHRDPLHAEEDTQEPEPPPEDAEDIVEQTTENQDDTHQEDAPPSTPSQSPLPPDSEQEEAIDETVPEEDMSISPMSIVPINPTTAGVSTYADLQTAIQGANTYTTFILQANINIGSLTGGISIPSSKSSITIDGQGLYSLNENALSGLSVTSNIYVPSGNATVTTITLQNTSVSGYSAYGPISVQSASNSNVTINYNNVTYSGPQLSYNSLGTINITNCTITIDGSKANSAPGGHVAEVSDITFYGTNNITIANNGTTSCFYLRGSTPTFINSANSNTTINAQRGVLLSMTTHGIFEVQANSKMTITTVSGFVDNAQSGKITNFYVRAGATAILKATSATSNDLAIRDSLIVENNATLDFRTAPTSTTVGPVIKMLSATGNKQALFTTPNRVIMYSSGPVSPFKCSGNITFSATVGSLNHWITTPNADTDSINNMPNGIWNKASGNLTVSCTVSSTNSLSNFTTNLVTTDPYPSSYPLNTTNFPLNDSRMRMIVMGSYLLSASSMQAGSATVTGASESGPTVGLIGSFTENTVTHTTTGTLPSGSTYSLTFDTIPQPTTTVTVMNSARMLKARANTNAVSGLTFLHTPGTITFSSAPISATTSTYYRDPSQAADQFLNVLDDRGGSASWHVTLTSSAITKTISPNSALNGYFTYNNGTTTYNISSSPTTIFSGTTNPNGTKYTWLTNTGLLLTIYGGSASTGTYTSTLTWTLIDGP